MRRLQEFAVLPVRTVRLWLSYLPQLVSIFLIGWIIRTLGTNAAVTIGQANRVLATLLYVVGVVAQVLAMIAMIRLLKPGLRMDRLTAGERRPGVPAEALRTEPLVDVLLLSIGPFLAVYAVWKLIDAWVSDLFLWNIALKPDLRAQDAWSISTDAGQLPLFLAIGGSAFILRIAYQFLTRGRRNPWIRLPLVVLESLWAFCLFLITLIGVDQLKTWLQTRAVTRWLQVGWQGFLDRLPDLTLPFGLTLPAAVAEATGWIWETLLPAVWNSFALPLAWLALAATVLGWRHFRVRDVVTGRLSERIDRFTPTSTAGRSLLRVGSVLGADLRDKYVPVLHALSLIRRAGPILLGAFIVWYAVLTTGQSLLHQLTVAWFGPGETDRFVAFMQWAQLPSELLCQTLLPALLVTTLDRGLNHLAAEPAEAPSDPEPALTRAPAARPARS